MVRLVDSTAGYSVYVCIYIYTYMIVYIIQYRIIVDEDGVKRVHSMLKSNVVSIKYQIALEFLTC